MNATEWEKIKFLFDSALKVPAEDRSRWVEEACIDSPELGETVVELLCNYDECSWSDPREMEGEPAFEPGQLVADRFVIVRLIGRGGMGEVYEARDRQLHGIRVALKTLSAGLATEQQALDRFKREVWIAREIAHEGICRVFDLIEHRAQMADGTESVIPCLTMKLLDGESLASYLARHRPMSCRAALPLIKQIADAIQAMHNKQIVHRDLKPSNVMLVPVPDSDAMQVILVDFGLAKRLNGEVEAWRTRTGLSQAGSPYYLAPELLKGERCSIAADVYALGLLVDEMVTERPAFHYDSLAELFWQKLNRDPERPSRRSRDLPKHWESAILSCLSRNPRYRPKTVSEVVEELQRVPSPWEALLLAGGIRRGCTVTREAFGSAVMSRRVWFGTAAAVAAVAAKATVGGTPTRLDSSILIFPFENLTNREEYDHICTGTTEELVRRLNYVRGLNAFTISKFWSVDQAALKTAQFSLKGQLRSSPKKLGLAIELIENGTGEVVWRRSFEEFLNQPLSLESEIAEESTQTIRERVAKSEGLATWVWVKVGWHSSQTPNLSPATLPPHPTASNAAFAEYQKGRELWSRKTIPSALEAVRCFERAIEADKQFALAYAALADVQSVFLNYNHGATPKLLNTALHYAERSVALDAELPECHVARAAACQALWNWPEAEKSYRTAIAKQPKFARAHCWLAGFLIQFGRFPAAFKEAEASQRLDPYDYQGQSNYGFYLWQAGFPKRASQQLEKLLKKADLGYAHIVLGQLYAELAGSSSEPDATEFFVKSLNQAAIVRSNDLQDVEGVDPGFLKWSDLIFSQVHSARKDMASASHFVKRLERGFEAGKISGSAVAWGYAAIDNRKRALELLDYGFQHHEREMLYVRVAPLFRRLRSDTRFQQILQQMKLA